MSQTEQTETPKSGASMAKRAEAWQKIIKNAEELGDDNFEALSLLKQIVFNDSRVVLEPLSDQDLQLIQQ